MKVQKSSQTITFFDGVYFADEAFDQSGLPNHIDKEFGVYASPVDYQCGDISGSVSVICVPFYIECIKEWVGCFYGFVFFCKFVVI